MAQYGFKPQTTPMLLVTPNMSSKPVFRISTLATMLLLALVLFSSCGSTKNLLYFKDLPDSTQIFLPHLKQQERVIEYGDRLNISITASDTDAISYFQTKGSTTTTGSSNDGFGHLVDPMGVIEFPILGKIKAVGLTARQLKDNLTGLIAKYAKDPLIEVQFTTFKVTVLGDVNSPGTHVLSMQRTTLFEVLAAAGDLAPTAKRFDLRLFRDYNGERSVTKFDLRTKDVLYNPEIFYLRHNDVIYVQPKRNKAFRDDFAFYTSFFGIIVSILSIAITFFNNN